MAIVAVRARVQLFADGESAHIFSDEEIVCQLIRFFTFPKLTCLQSRMELKEDIPKFNSGLSILLLGVQVSFYCGRSSDDELNVVDVFVRVGGGICSEVPTRLSSASLGGDDKFSPHPSPSM